MITDQNLCLMDISKLTDTNIEAIKYFLMYLKDKPNSIDSMLASEYSKKLNVLIGTDWITGLIEIIKLDSIEFENFKISNREYFMGEENSPAYRWLIKIWREIQLQKLEI